MHVVHPRRARRASAALTVLATSALLIAPSGSAAPATGETPADGHGRLPVTAEAVGKVSPAYARLPRDVRLVRTRTSLLGTHEWYRQVRNGHDVVGAWYVRHIDNTTGRVTVWDGRRQFSKVQPAAVTISSTDAEVTAAKAADAPPQSAETAALMVLPTGGSSPARLVWPVHTATGHGATTSYVDAATGQVLKTVVSAQKLTTRSATRVTGRGRVFDPNPVVKLQDQSLTDHGDAAAAVPRAAYTIVTLHRLDGSHTLVGRWVRIVNRDLASSSTNSYLFNRANDKFEQVNAYHSVDVEQQYLRRLGFHDANAEAQKVKVDAFADDNSYYDPSRDKISLGSGGVDDAEDPEVVWHEYGHAIQNDQVLDWGWTPQGQAIGEGFGDYMSVTMSQHTAAGTRVTPAACVMDWDATSYTYRRPHCLRRTNTNLHYPGDLTGEEHNDGQIWSRALWDMNRELGRNLATRIIVEAQFWMNPKVTMPRAARITVAIARKLRGDAVAAVTRKAFADRGILKPLA